MSSTNRGGQRNPADNYATPSWCIRRLAENLGLPKPLPMYRRWLEPCVGDGSIVKTINSLFGQTDTAAPSWTGVELREEVQEDLASIPFEALHCPQNFLEWETNERFDIAITNPPFRLAQPILEKCLGLADYVIFLLRLNYVGSEKRHSFMTERMPNQTLVLPNRPPFSYNKDGKWGTDSIEYAWFVWDSVNPTNEGKIRMLPLTPLEERKQR